EEGRELRGLLLTPALPLRAFRLSAYGSASTMIRKRKVPVVWMPSRNCTLTLAPFASGVPSVTDPAESVELMPPPLGCAGGDSSVVPCTVTVHGAAPAEDAVQVVWSLTGETELLVDVSARRSATPPPGEGKVVNSTMRNRSRVTDAPV